MICPNPACRRVWRYTGDAEWICCPSCHRKFRRPEQVIEILGDPLGSKATCDWCGFGHAPIYPCRIDGESTFLCTRCIGTPP